MESQTICPECNGKKIIVGNCECNMEWRGPDGDDCICEPDLDCPSCKGKGVIDHTTATKAG